MDVGTFRANLPEFRNVRHYPDGQVARYIALGLKQLDAVRWDDLLDHGLELFTAHHLVLMRQRAKAASTGGVPGGASGPTTSKTVDKVSVSYDATLSSEPGAGHWNLTTYGAEYIRLARMIGSGGVQL